MKRLFHYACHSDYSQEHRRPKVVADCHILGHRYQPFLPRDLQPKRDDVYLFADRDGHHASCSDMKTTIGVMLPGAWVAIHPEFKVRELFILIIRGNIRQQDARSLRQYC